MVAEKQLDIAQHAIQLNYVGVKDITFHCDRLPNTLDLSNLEGPNFFVGRGDYDPEANTIHVIHRIELSLPDTKSFVFRVELVSEFSVDEAAFPVEKVHDWADRASFYVVFPYLREEVYALSIRVGMKPVLLPLLQIPTFRVEKLTPADRQTSVAATV